MIKTQSDGEDSSDEGDTVEGSWTSRNMHYLILPMGGVYYPCLGTIIYLVCNVDWVPPTTSILRREKAVKLGGMKHHSTTFGEQKPTLKECILSLTHR